MDNHLQKQKNEILTIIQPTGGWRYELQGNSIEVYHTTTRKIQSKWTVRLEWLELGLTFLLPDI